jgi:cytochrome c oxidase subunit 2
MLSKVRVIPEADFSAWYFGDSSDAPVLGQAEAGVPDATRGERVFKLKGCVACHSTDGSKLVGPTWKGLFDSKLVVIADDQETPVTADEAYLRRSISHPPKEVVKGFAPQMPKADLKERDIADLIAFIKGLQ